MLSHALVQFLKRQIIMQFPDESGF